MKIILKSNIYLILINEKINTIMVFTVRTVKVETDLIKMWL